MEGQVHKPHRKAKEKKKQAGPNPKAFSFSNPGKLLRAAGRSHDIKEKRLHVPLVDRLPDEPPPRLVAIAGPPGVGKSTLLRSLIRRYAKETISEPQGPITVVTSKKQRLTFIECPNELEGMIDIAKVADVVLLMIDGNFGFEMETFEFINVLASNGMPGHVFGILTHLDLFRKPQALKDAKKRIKHRLWSETYQGAHLFYLSGVINGRYPDREIHNLSRFLSVMKNPRPLVWRNSHPYTVVDSFLDATHPAEIEKDEKCDRTVVLSGYLRGTNFAAQGQRVHIPGLGYDLTIANMELLPDPCSTPAMDKAMEMVTGKTRRRRLDEKDKRLYAPMSDRSGLKIDGDAIYIYREKGFTFDKDADVERGEGEELMIRMQENRKLLGQTDEGMQLFRGGEAVQLAPEEHDTGRKTQRRARLANGDQESDDGGGHDDEPASELDNFDARGLEEGQFGRTARSRANKSDSGGDIVFPEADSDLGSLSSGDEEDGLEFDSEDLDDDEDDPAVRWKENMAERARSLHQRRRPYQASALARMMYDESLSIDEVLRRWKGEDDDGLDEEGTEEAEDEFFQKSRIDKLEEDRATPNFDYDKLAARWTADAVENLRHSLLKRDGAVRNASDDDEDSEGDGVFEDLETGEKHGAQSNPGPQAEPEDFEDERDKNARRKEELKLRFEEEDREGFNNPKAIARREGGDQDEFGEDEWYDAQKALMQKQLDINKAEYEALDERQRVTVEGFRAGNYAKMVIKGVPAEFVKTFNARMPLIVGGLAATEDRFGFVQVRVKRHRWFPKKVLKANDPLIFSLGWRRFQTLPIYSISDSRTRNRLLKYTPEHMHCFGTFYGPLIAPNTGFVCFQSFSAAEPGFRIAASGTVLNVDESTEIVKKLKLTGEPYKIFSNTAFIKGMFNSALEVAKFEGAAIKTVSGIRGQIKRALSKPEGNFRATFEDKILASDIVILRAWYPIKPRRFYNPVTNLIGWHRMRTTGEIRRDEGIATPQQKNSRYREISRPTRHFNPLRVSRKLAASLPFKSQIIHTKKQKKRTYMQKRAVVVGGEERKARDLMQKLSTIRKDRDEKRGAKKEQKRSEFRTMMQGLKEKRDNRDKRETQEFWAREGKKRKASDESGGGGKRRK